MADIKQFVTPDNLGPDFEQDATAKEIKLNIDGVTLIRNADGKLEAVGGGEDSVVYNITELPEGATAPNATRDNALAAGVGAEASGLNSVAIGINAGTSGIQSTALGANAISSGLQSTALGYNANTTKPRQVSFAPLSETTHLSTNPRLLSGVKAPEVGQDAANKEYVDDLTKVDGTTITRNAEGELEAAVDVSLITGAMQKSANLSDLTNTAEARINLGLGLATRNADGLLSKEDKFKLDNLAIYPNTDMEKLKTALYVEYTAPITDVPYGWEVSENGLVWGDSSVLTGVTNKIFVRNRFSPTTISQTMNYGEVVRILYWGDDIEQLTVIGGEHLVQVPITPPKSLKIAYGMFANATNFNQDISSWDVGNIQIMAMMFANASSFTQDLSSWDGSNAVHDDFAIGSGIENSPEKHPMWESPIEYIYNDLGEIVTYVASPRASSDTFYQKDGLWFYIAPEGDMDFRLFFQNGEMYEPFRESSEEGVIATITDSRGNSHEIPLNQVVTSKVTSLNNIFDASSINFNQDISKWDVSNVTNMAHMFSWSFNFNGNISAWDTSNVEDMRSMFLNAQSFNGDISSWDTGSVEYMGGMFRNAQSFNGDISSWDTGSVEDMGGMFEGAVSFNQDLSQWCVSEISNRPYNFDENTPNWDKTNRLPVWGSCPE